MKADYSTARVPLFEINTHEDEDITCFLPRTEGSMRARENSPQNLLINRTNTEQARDWERESPRPVPRISISFEEFFLFFFCSFPSSCGRAVGAKERTLPLHRPCEDRKGRPRSNLAPDLDRRCTRKQRARASIVIWAGLSWINKVSSSLWALR